MRPSPGSPVHQHTAPEDHAHFLPQDETASAPSGDVRLPAGHPGRPGLRRRGLETEARSADRVREEAGRRPHEGPHPHPRLHPPPHLHGNDDDENDAHDAAHDAAAHDAADDDDAPHDDDAAHDAPHDAAHGREGRIGDRSRRRREGQGFR